MLSPVSEWSITDHRCKPNQERNGTMPNHCYTTMTVDGPSEDVDRFVTVVDSGTSGFIPTLVPLPEGASQYDEWGTKWGDMETELIYHDNGGPSGEGAAQYSYWTPWGPADVAQRKISEMFPSLEFTIRFWDEGMGFVGAGAFINGVAVIRTDDLQGLKWEDLFGVDDWGVLYAAIDDTTDLMEAQALTACREQVVLLGRI